MSNRNYESQILDAIQILVDNAVSKANYDKTIKATIVRCVDATIGKYVVRYQDSSFYAYSHNTDNTYTSGTMVYVLIPANDMSQDKSIIGTVDKLGIDYVSIIEGENGYEVTGVNAINSQIDFELNSYKSEDIKILYHRDNNIKLIDLDEFGFKTYMEQSNSIICGATFTTKLPTEQRTRGDYGIVFDLDFIDNATGETVTRSYMLNIDQMTGQPYNYTTPSRQYDIFEVDGSNFISVKQIYIFAYNFPYTAEDKSNDIIVSKIELSAANALDKEAAATAALTFITPKGVYFEDNHLDSDERLIEAQIRIKGQIVDNSSQDIKYYWFRENGSITNKSEKYNKLGGAGWECLNLFNVIQEASEDSEAIVEWIPSSYQFITKKQDNIARETKYKCIAVYGEETVLTKVITIYNYSSDFDIKILSDDGTSFYYDIGNPTLTCYINEQEETGDEYSYVWSSIDNTGRFSRIEETPSSNDAYNDAASHLKQLEEQIAANEVLTAATQQEVQLYRNILKQYEYEMRVEKNKIHQLKVSTITNFTTYKCSVFKNGVGIGTASIIISNSLNNESNYSLVINNGNQVFKYNEDGLAPTCKALMNPISILPLSFTLYDKEGKSISINSIGSKNIKWKVPKDRTLIKCLDSYGSASSEDEKYFIYNDLAEFGFSLYDVYNTSKDFNEIVLEITYKKQVILAKTNFTFTKTGEMGTNHSNYICKIIPNTKDEVMPKHPTLIYNEMTDTYDMNYTRPTGQEKQWFKVQLWHGSEKILDTITSSVSEEGLEAKVVWSILQNDYGRDSQNVHQMDKSNFTVSSETAEFDFVKDEISNPANIIKCTVSHNGIDHYATMPIIVSRVKDNSFTIDLKENTGFQYAIYNADGQKPEYDDKFPFELYVTQIINEIKEPISLTEIENYKLSYKWSEKGNVYYSEWQPSYNLIARGQLESDTRNQKRYRLSDTYNGLCVNNAVECIVSNKEGRVGSIHIPVHLYINRYGNAAMNGWDGNSISFDNEGGLILAPQVGAGSKNADGTFSGVFIGSVKERGAREEEHGLFGYGSGQRTLTLNSVDGSAVFGKKGGGQIIINPASGEALLTSGNYSEKDKTGMEINLSEPSIKFGSGKFSVDKDGNVVAESFATKAYVKEEIDGVNKEISDLEASVKVVDMQLHTASVLIPCNIENVPLKAADYIINYDVLFKGQKITSGYSIDIEEDGDIRGLSVNTSTLGKIIFSTHSNIAVPLDINNYNVTIHYETYSITKQISVVLAPQGENGKSAYQIWLENGGSGSEQDYLNSLRGEPGTPGGIGPQGVGIKSIEEQYYWSTSDEQLEGGSWSFTQGTPTEQNPYLWTRSFITWTDNVTATTDGVLAQAINNANTTAQSALGTANKTSQEFENYKTENDALIKGLQDQIDGSISTWFYNYNPNTENTAPTNEWTTPEEKERHVGDLFYITDGDYSGQCYRYVKLENGTYKWAVITDAEVAKALENAAKAQESADAAQATADNKMTVFLEQPKPPYSVGDLWIDKTNGIQKTCKTERLTGSFSSSDWEHYLKYTDDTVANEAKALVKTTVKTVDVEYYLSTSKDSPTGGSWNPQAPAWAENKYMWSRTKITYQDENLPATYEPSENGTCIAGATGQPGTPGAAGKGIKSIAELYYLATTNLSKLDAPTTHVTNTSATTTNAWTTVCPTWKDNCYYWTCSEILYTDNNYGWSKPILAAGLNNANSKASAASSAASKAETDAKDASDKAQEAWDKASSAQSTAQNAQDAIESLGVGGRNLCTKRTPRVTSEVSLDYSGYSWKMEFAGGSAYSGLIIPATIFTPGKQYVISFDIRDINGNVSFIGGHSSAYGDIRVDRNGEYLSNSWASTSANTLIPDTLNHFEVHCTFTPTEGSSANNDFYIQPERGSTDSYLIVISNIKVEEGNIATAWTPAVEDGIQSIETLYTLSSNRDIISEKVDGKDVEIENNKIEWKKSVSATADKPYVWQITRTTYLDSYTEDTNLFCLSKTERYVESIKTQYIATKKDTQPGTTGWSYVRPQWTTEYPWIWVRTEISWSDGSTPDYEDMYLDQDALSLQTKINQASDTIVNDLENGYVRIYKNQILILSSEYTHEEMASGKVESMIVIGSQGIATYKKKIENGQIKNPITWDETAQQWKGDFSSTWQTEGIINAQDIQVRNLKAEDIQSGILTLKYDNNTEAKQGQLIVTDSAGATIVEANGDGVIVHLTGSTNKGGSIKITKTKGLEAIAPGGAVSYGSSADNSAFNAKKINVEEQIDFASGLRGLVVKEKTIGGLKHKGIGFIKI